MYCIYTLYSSIPRIHNPSANQTQVQWLEGEHENHYTMQLATMQWQNVVFKPKAWEKGNGSERDFCMINFYF